ncbi:EamA family transporter [uncultured Jatrophihabitans sp.]|uniref:EamA family transporter n=1 Tax=uncultured Jatrophihabitans sp. TaxID=1610747 RepID=UPI0035CC4045
MTVVLGLLAALFYGVGDFAGGFASRRNGALTVLLWSYPVGALLMTIMLPFFAGGIDGRVVGFGIAGGVAGMVGVVVMYDLMTVAPMNVVSPVTAVLAAIVPVVVGVSIGERPHVSAWFGILLGLAAIALVSRTSETNPHGHVGPRVLALALLSGLGFGFYFVFLARAGGHTGLWPLVVSRYASALLIIPLAKARGALIPIRNARAFAVVIAAGAFDALANMFFLLATHTGLLSLASVLTSLYPVTTVVLAVTFLREHTTPVQRAGLVLAAGAVVLITV